MTSLHYIQIKRSKPGVKATTITQQNKIFPNSSTNKIMNVKFLTTTLQNCCTIKYSVALCKHLTRNKIGRMKNIWLSIIPHKCCVFFLMWQFLCDVRQTDCSTCILKRFYIQYFEMCLKMLKTIVSYNVFVQCYDFGFFQLLILFGLKWSFEQLKGKVFCVKNVCKIQLQKVSFCVSNICIM